MAAAAPVAVAPAPTPPAGAGLMGVARALVVQNVIDEAKAKALVQRATADSITFLEALSRDSRPTARRASEALARMFDMPLIDLESVDAEQFPPEPIFDRKKIEELRAVPISVRGNRLFVATADPTNTAVNDYYAAKSGKRVEIAIVDDAQVSAFLAQLAGAKADMSLPEEDLNFDMDAPEPEVQGSAEDEMDAVGENSPVVKLVKGIILTAIKRGSSDIHFEPYEKFYRVRFRVDGALQEVTRPPAAYGNFIASRIKVISGLNIAEKRIPQDGRMKMRLPGGRSIDFRVSTLPTLYGEKIVMRILDPSQAKLGIEALGYEPEEKARLLEAIGRPYGMVLVTGPTGSGKTVSLYTCLNLLNRDDINISTAEDPAEIQLGGINQVNVNVAQGLTFAAALKSFLRQDPDIIMVGEIRDEETAEISVKAAQTGHMVLATLHTNDAPKTISRLIEIGVKPYNVAGSVILITAQRLARKLCTHCKKPDDGWTKSALVDAGMTEQEAGGYGSGWKAYKANADGCSLCTKGYKGRVGIYQVMPISEEIRRIIMDGGDAMAISAQAQKEGVRDLRQSALLKFRAGVTSMDEVVGVTNE